MANPSLLDIAKLNLPEADKVIELSIQDTPEVRVLPWDTIPGTTYPFVLRTSIPMGGFRNANEGQTPVVSTWANRIVQTYIMDIAVEVDKAVADAYKRGKESYMAKEAVAILKGAWRALGSQFYYGTGTTLATSQASQPTKGFPGLIEVYDSTNMTVDAGGSGSDMSSVWFVAAGEDYVQWILGRDGAIEVGDVQDVRLLDTNTPAKPYAGYRLPLLGYPGLQAVNTKAVVRIKDVEPDKPLTDDLMYEALDLFPTGIMPTAIFMSRRSRRELRESRTATNATGSPAPNPTEFEGVPIHVTDSIVNTEVSS